MSKAPFTDVMRVEVTDLDGHLIRVLDLRIEAEVVLQGNEWKPGVAVPANEADAEAAEIAYQINESSNAWDADGLPVGTSEFLHDGNDEPTAKWRATRVPVGTPKPTLCEFVENPGFNP